MIGLQMMERNTSTIGRLKHPPGLRLLDVHPLRNRRVDLDTEETRAMAATYSGERVVNQRMESSLELVF